MVVVFAAGNDNSNIDVTPQFPAVYPEVMAVAATDPNDRKAGFSNFGGPRPVNAYRALTSLGRRRGVAVFGRDPAGDKKSL